MEVWLATSNKGKISEFKQLLPSENLDIHHQGELSYFNQPPEDGESFADNAKIKARALHAMVPHAWVLADDSGLVVPGLNGLPGVHSARYAGPKASDGENVAKLLKMVQIRCSPKPEASFQCCLCAISPSGEELLFTGELLGHIAQKSSGQGGFGYDPVFIPKNSDRTLAEHTAAEKNALSHRAQAIKALLKHLEGTWDDK